MFRKRFKHRRKRSWRFSQISLLLSLFLCCAYLVGACSGDRATSEPVSPLSQASPALSCGSSSGGPTENPVTRRYADPALAWTDELKWECVYNIEDFDGATDGDRFDAAKDAAIAAGGGVIYFPAGTYTFADDLLLANGIVVRGEVPSTSDAKSEAYAPPTQFQFPQYEPVLSGTGTPNETAFKQITTAAPDTDSNLGLVDIDINRAAVNLVSQVDAAENQNIVIFGVRSNNVARPDARVPDLAFQDAWMRFSDRFAANIKISAYANVLVANNRLNDAVTDTYDQPGYSIRSVSNDDEIITYAEGWKVPFSYTDHYGIVVNRSKEGGFGYGTNPETEPGLFRQGIVIRDNWVYKTMRVGIHASGSGLVIRGNEIRDRPNKSVWADPRGIQEPKGATTFENRGIDWSGWNVFVEENDYEVHRHQVKDSQYFSVDGEGILIQECCGGTSINQATIQNNQGNSYIGLYKVPDIENVVIQNNEISADGAGMQLIYVSADTNNGSNSMSNVRIEGNTLNGGILAKASAGGERNFIRGNQGDGSGEITYSCSVEALENEGFEVKSCS